MMKKCGLLLIHLVITGILYPSENVVFGEISEERKIDYLIACVENLEDAVFIRNGTSYDSMDAASHLRLKRKRAGSRLSTASDFVENLASHSRFSGRPYLIRYNDGREVEAKKFFQQHLDELGGE